MADKSQPDEERVVPFPEQPRGAKPSGKAAGGKSAPAAEPDEWDDAAAKGTSKGEEEEEGKGSKQADIMVGYVSSSDLFRDRGGIAYADIMVEGHRETWPVRSATFRHWIVNRFYAESGTVAAAQGVAGAINTIEARATRGGRVLEVSVRSCAVGDDRIYIDMGDVNWRVIEVTPTGWKIIAAAPGGVRFRRTAGMGALPEPVGGGDLEQMRELFNFAEGSDFRLAVVWELAVLRGRGGHPPIVFNGESGTAKTTTAMVMRTLVDPAVPEVRGMPANERDLAIAANAQHLLVIDNISYLPKAMSDAFCQLATGGARAARALWTDDGERIFDAVRPVILAGIESFVRRGDLTNRSVFLGLKRIDDANRMTEEAFRERLARSAPMVLGFLLNVAAGGLRHLPAVREEVKSLPRMASFALWAAACERGMEGMPLGDMLAPTWKRGEVLADYEANRADADLALLEGDPVGRAIQRLPKGAFPPKEATDQNLCVRWHRGAEEGSLEWRGSATELLDEMEEVTTSQRDRGSRYWPGGANALTGKLRRVAPMLRKAGVTADVGVRFSRGNARGIRIAFTAAAVGAAKELKSSDEV